MNCILRPISSEMVLLSFAVRLLVFWIYQSSWKTYKDGLYDSITIQVEEKEFKVSGILKKII
jgi:hypothetical protein